MNKTIVALALAFFASTASAAIGGSAHDFVGNGYVTPAPSTACIFCHVPHGGQNTVTGLPLWAPARSLTNPTAFYTGLRNGTITITGVDPKGTQTCLGCHATGTAAAMGTTTDLPANVVGGTQLIVGTDIANDHPVGNEVTITPGANGLQSTITLGGASITGGSMQCSTCHDVHNATLVVQAGSKLLRSYTGDFCVACHNK